METELLKEPWTFPQSKMDLVKEEEKPTSLMWEENFQDLSSWCMETFQGHCDFHTGESPAYKLSGTKYEGNSVLSSEEGILKDLISVPDEEKWNVKMNNAATNDNYTTGNCQSLGSPSKLTSTEKDDSTGESTVSQSWLRLPKETAPSTTTVTTTTWNRDTTATVTEPFQQTKYEIEHIDVDEAYPSSFDSGDDQLKRPPETWDVLRTVETTGSESFDLLSYLCDDEMRSPEGSVSTDSSVLSKQWSIADSSPTTPQSFVRGTRHSARLAVSETTEPEPDPDPVTSTEVRIVTTVSPRKSERLRSSSSSATQKIDKPYTRISKRERPARRRTESASEDRTFALHYRESREKNNEASRKSRMNKKAKESEMASKAIELEKDNRILKMKVEELEKLVTSMRSALLRSAMKKEI